MSFILALDQGTTSSRAILFDQQGNIHGVAQREFQQLYPQAGWVEHDPLEIWASQKAVMEEVTATSTEKPHAIGITNQRETTVVWDRATGAPVYNAIVWQDRRTAGFCDQLKRDGHATIIQSKTGLVIDAYFSGSKVTWILDNVPGARDRAGRGELAFGTVDSWLVWQLTNGKVHVTDPSNASRTMLFNIHTGSWDADLLTLFRIPASMLPEVKSSSEVYGETSKGIPIAGIAGDQQAALFGQMCLTPGMSKNTYGTGCFLLQQTGAHATESKNKLLTTIAWKINGKTEYALEGSVFIGGAVVQWLRDGLGIIQSAAEIEGLARSVPDNGGVYLVPAFAGLGTPHWDQYARGTMVGLTRGTTKAHIARAALEGIAFQVADLLAAMRADAGIPLTELRVDGGASLNNLLMQIQADLLGVPVVRPKVSETTALGAAYLAGLATGFWSSTAEIATQWQVDQRYETQMNREQANAMQHQWQRAVERSKGWIEQ